MEALLRGSVERDLDKTKPTTKHKDDGEAAHFALRVFSIPLWIKRAIAADGIPQLFFFQNFSRFFIDARKRRCL